ncbi:MAG: hypothetical protein WB384_02875 [Candidatus Sulfotelmatobacter sp.]
MENSVKSVFKIHLQPASPVLAAGVLVLVGMAATGAAQERDPASSRAANIPAVMRVTAETLKHPAPTDLEKVRIALAGGSVVAVCGGTGEEFGALLGRHLPVVHSSAIQITTAG